MNLGFRAKKTEFPALPENLEEQEEEEEKQENLNGYTQTVPDGLFDKDSDVTMIPGWKKLDKTAKKIINRYARVFQKSLDKSMCTDFPPPLNGPLKTLMTQ